MALSIRALDPDPIAPPLGSLAEALLARPLPAAPPPDRFDREERDALAVAIERQLVGLRPHVAVLDSIRALRAPGACMAIASHRPSFAGGPLSSLYAALSALRLAAHLRDRWQVPVIPVLWSRADDIESSGLHRALFLNENLDLSGIGLSGMSSASRLVAREPLREEHHRLGAITQAIRAHLPENERRERVLELFLPREGEDLAQAFVRTLTELLGAHGLVVIDPAWLRIDLARALAHTVSFDVRGPFSALREGIARAREDDPIPPFDPERCAWVLRRESIHGEALREGGDGFQYDMEPGSRTASELAAEIVQSPGEFSPGELLDPLIQDLALPVAARACSPGELARAAVLEELRARAGVPVVPLFPSLTCTLLDPRSRASLERTGLEIEDVLFARGQLAAVANAHRGQGCEIAAKLRSAVSASRDQLLDLRAELAELDRGLAMQLKRAADQARGLIDKLATKADRVHANRAGSSRRHLRRLDNALFPQGQPQDQVLTTLQLVARHGTAWIEELLVAFDPRRAAHLAVQLDDDSNP